MKSRMIVFPAPFQVELSEIDMPVQVAEQDAIFAKGGAIAWHGVKRGRATGQETVAVVGLGPIGHQARHRIQCTIDLFTIRFELLLI